MLRTALVTGGAGFIGSHLVRALIERGFAVRVLDNLSTGRTSSIVDLPMASMGLQFINDDIRDFEVFEAACRDIEVVFHLAAIPSVTASVKDPISTQHCGEIAMLCLLKAAVRHGVRRIVFASSASAYGDGIVLPYSETMAPRPLSPYAASKLACEHYLRAYCECHSMDGISLRYFNVYGQGQHPGNQYAGVISKFLDAMKKGESPVIRGDGTQTRDFVHVSDVVEANLLAMDCGHPLNGFACNVGSGQQTSINALVSELNNALGTDIKPLFAARLAGDPWNSCASIDFARKILGFEPRIEFAEGIRMLALGN